MLYNRQGKPRAECVFFIPAYSHYTYVLSCISWLNVTLNVNIYLFIYFGNTTDRENPEQNVVFLIPAYTRITHTCYLVTLLNVTLNVNICLFFLGIQQIGKIPSSVVFLIPAYTRITHTCNLVTWLNVTLNVTITNFLAYCFNLYLFLEYNRQCSFPHSCIYSHYTYVLSRNLT